MKTKANSTLQKSCLRPTTQSCYTTINLLKRSCIGFPHILAHAQKITNIVKGLKICLQMNLKKFNSKMQFKNKSWVVQLHSDNNIISKANLIYFKN